MDQQNSDITIQNSTDDIQDSLSAIDMPEHERYDKLKLLEAEISMLERAHVGGEVDSDLPALSNAEQRHLNWLMNWENFDRMIEKNADYFAFLFHTENDALSNLALEKLYRSTNENALADEYLAKAKQVIKAYIIQMSDSPQEKPEETQFQDPRLAKIFEEQCLELANKAETA